MFILVIFIPFKKYVTLKLISKKLEWENIALIKLKKSKFQDKKITSINKKITNKSLDI